MTAAEKVAWSRTKVDLADVAPGFKSLDDKAIANKMMDREWVQDAVTKAREKAEAFEQVATRARTEQARREAVAKRERLMDLAEQLEDQLRLTPKQKLGQGPKTREAQRNMLNPNPSNQNNLMR
jgi:DNA uptake protein ComE-like DNA-binding protein